MKASNDPVKMFVPDTPSLCDHMVWRGALQRDFSHKMRLVHLKVLYYCALTLSSNGTEILNFYVATCGYNGDFHNSRQLTTKTK